MRRAGGTERVGRRVAAALAEHPDVLLAYWDTGLARLVVTATEDALTDRVVDHATELAERHGLTRVDQADLTGLTGPDEPVDVDPVDGGPIHDDLVDEPDHPGDPAPVRVAAAALGADVLGIAAAVTGARLRLPPSPRLVTAVATLLRENPAFRAWLRERLGDHRMDVALAAANAAVHGAGQSPTSLVLDGALRVCQLTEAVARGAAFEVVHDRLCVPGRDSLPAVPALRPPPRTSPAQDYAAHASAGSVAGAAATLLVKHDLAEAAEAVLAGSPKAARYGPAAFHAVLSAALSRTGVLVRDPGRLRQLEMARTVVLHPSALRVPDAGADPWTEDVLDAARRAGLRVVMVEDPALADFTGLADQVVGAHRPLADVVAELRAEGGVVTVVRPLPGDDGSVSAGLLAGDVAVALADGDCPVAWGADVLAPQGLADVWRVLRAVPVARAVGRRSQTLARSGAALSGLLVAVGEARGRSRGGVSSLLGMRHAPVDASAALALLSGTRAAIGVATARAPHPRARVAWHALDPQDVRERLEREREPEPTAVEQATARMRAAADRAGRVPVLAPVRWSWQLARAVRGELDDPLTPVLAVGSAASAILGSVVDALLVVGALDLNALVGGFQRLRAERALSGLLAEQKQKARVAEEQLGPDAADFTPEGEPRIVDAAKLHPGHVIELKADDVVPADARLLWEDGLEVDESALTGESLPVDKCVDPAPRAPVAERYCMVFEGTTVVAGRARAVVVDTGDHTEAARAVALAARTPSAAGVQARLQELTRKALPLTLAGGAAVTGLSLLRGAPIRQAVAARRVGGGGRRARGTAAGGDRGPARRGPPARAAGASWCAPRARWRRSAGWTPSASTRRAPSPRTGCGCPGSRAPTARYAGRATRRPPTPYGPPRAPARGWTATAPGPPTPPTRRSWTRPGTTPGGRRRRACPSRPPAATPPQSDARTEPAPPCWWSRALRRRCCPPAPGSRTTPWRWRSGWRATDCASSRWRGGPWRGARRPPTSSNSRRRSWSSPDCSRSPTCPARPPRRWCAGCARRAYGPWC